MSDDPGVMGNLPRARPGRRSDKRVASSKPRTAKAAAASGPPKAPTRPRKAQAPKARRPAKPAEPAPQPEPAGQSSFDPVGDAVKVAGSVAGFGLKVAGGVLKRLPGR